MLTKEEREKALQMYPSSVSSEVLNDLENAKNFLLSELNKSVADEQELKKAIEIVLKAVENIRMKLFLKSKVEVFNNFIIQSCQKHLGEGEAEKEVAYSTLLYIKNKHQETTKEYA